MAKSGDRFIAKSLVLGLPDMEITFRFIQPGFEYLPESSMYDLIVDIPEHPKDSTISRNTLENKGFVLPEEAP